MPPFFLSDAAFSLFFADQSPFDWKRQSVVTTLPGPNLPGTPQLLPTTLLLAEGDTQDRGEYKYGVEITNPATRSPIYDEDPYLVVY